MYRLLTLSGAIVLFDQILKICVKGFSLFGIENEGMYPGESIPFIGNLVKLTFVENKGMAFGLDLGMPLLLGLFSIGAAIFLIHLIRKSRTNDQIQGFHIALALVLGGAIGNLIDRVFYGLFYGYAPLFKGKVVDFVDVDVPDIDLFGFALERFYVFNLADSAISIGMILLLIFYPKFQQSQERASEQESELNSQPSEDFSNGGSLAVEQDSSSEDPTGSPGDDNSRGEEQQRSSD